MPLLAWNFGSAPTIGAGAAGNRPTGCPRAAKKNPWPVNRSRVAKPEALPVHPWTKHHSTDCGSLRGAPIFRGRFSSPAVCNDFKRNRLALVEGIHAGAFNCTDMNENILAALVRLNEAENPFGC
jgi:hypothetical protein